MKLAVVSALAGLVCVSSSRPWLVGVGLAVFVLSCLVALRHLERTSRVSVVPDAAGVRPRPQGCAPVDPTGTSLGRRDWSPRPGDAIRRHWPAVAVGAVLAGVLVLIGCQPDDSGTDGVVQNDCAEMHGRPEGCD